MTDLYFVDTNVLVYTHDTTNVEKHVLASQWVESLWRTRTGRLSIQVLIEFHAVVTRPNRPQLTFAQAVAAVERFFVWDPQAIDATVVRRAWALQERYLLSWWDALIVAAAQRQGCRYLLSKDLQHGQVLDSVEVVNPFSMSPAEVT